MIKTLIDRLVATYPTEIEAAAHMFMLAVPWLLIMAALWLVADAVEWLIDWNERRCTERDQRLRYRTASEQQLDRDMQQLWRRANSSADALPEADPLPYQANTIRAAWLRKHPKEPLPAPESVAYAALIFEVLGRTRGNSFLESPAARRCLLERVRATPVKPLARQEQRR